MKVLYIVSLFPCWSETFIVREMAGLRGNGLSVPVLSLKPPSETMVQTDAEEMQGDVIYSEGILSSALAYFLCFFKHPIAMMKIHLALVKGMWRMPKSLIYSLSTVAIVCGVLDKIKKQAPDHIHAHWATYPSTAAYIINQLANIPYSFTFHAHDIFLEDHILKEKFETCRFGISISRFNIAYIKQLLNRDYSNKIKIVHCGVDLKVQNFVEQDRLSSTIMAIGRLDEIKGFVYLVEACKELQEAGKEFVCNIIGDGPLRPQFESLIADYGLEGKVNLLGAKPQEEVRRHLETSTVFALPSVCTKEGNMDGIPVALMEAMASGIPVVSTKVSGIPELIEDGKNGYLIEPANPSQLAATLKNMLADESLRHAMAKQARLTIEEQFTSSIEAKKLSRHFEQASAS